MKSKSLVFMGLCSLVTAAYGCGGDVNSSTSGNGGKGGETTTSEGGKGGEGGMTTTSEGGKGGEGGTTTTGGGGTGGTTSTTTPTEKGDPAIAVRKLYLGDKDMDGNPSTTAWQNYGVNIDDLVSTAASTDLCIPSSGATPATVYPDGPDGLDNSFGKNLLPLLLSLNMNFSTQVNNSIEGGQFSILGYIDGIAPAETGTFTSSLFTAGFSPGTVPNWDGNDVWPIRADSLNNGDIKDPKAYYPMSDVSIDGSGMRIWASNGLGDVTLAFPVLGVTFSVPIHLARFKAPLSDDNTTVTGGILAGVLDTEEIIAEFAKVAGTLDPNLCPPSATFESIAAQVRQASDILKDGTQDPLVECNGITIGLGFDAQGAMIGPVFDPPVTPDPCAP